jgi:hypothetical protein
MSTENSSDPQNLPSPTDAMVTTPNSSQNVPQVATPIIPPEVEKLFGDPPLLQGDSPADYKALTELAAADIKPQSLMEWLFTKDIVNYTWEHLRLQRLKCSLIDLNRKDGVKKVLSKVIHPDRKRDIEALANGWFTHATTRAHGLDVLTKFGISEECIYAQVMVDNAAGLMMINNLAGTALSRRDAAFRQLLRRREQQMLSRRTAARAATESVSLAPQMADQGEVQP